MSAKLYNAEYLMPGINKQEIIAMATQIYYS